MKYLDKEENGFVQFHIPHELLNDFKTSNNTNSYLGIKWKLAERFVLLHGVIITALPETT